jgi:hypothetical protein
MNEQVTKSDYLLIFRNTSWHVGLSPEELQGVTTQWMAWFERLSNAGKVKGANPLENEGRIVVGNDRTVTDGPFAESKEAIGGYFLLQLDSLEEAVAIAKECPSLKYGAVVEVRVVASQCVQSQIANEELTYPQS